MSIRTASPGGPDRTADAQVAWFGSEVLLSTGRTTIPVSDLTSGFYLVRVIAGETVHPAARERDASLSLGRVPREKAPQGAFSWRGSCSSAELGGGFHGLARGGQFGPDARQFRSGRLGVRKRATLVDRSRCTTGSVAFICSRMALFVGRHPPG